jgi:hypothetical protein
MYETALIGLGFISGVFATLLALYLAAEPDPLPRSRKRDGSARRIS